MRKRDAYRGTPRKNPAGTAFLPEVLLTSVLLLTCELAFPLSPAQAGEELSVKGFLSIDQRFLVEQTDTPIVDFYHNLQIEMRATPGSKVNALASFDLRYYDYPEGTNTIESLQTIDTPTPLDISLWEGYVDIYGFLSKNLDLRLGKQRISWGTADKLNPTDNLNPDDFSDPLDFGKKIPSTAFMGTYYFGDWQVIGIWLPAIRPVLFPSSGFDPIALYGADISTEDIQLQLQNMNNDYPKYTLPNSMGAVKVKGYLLNTDISVSFFHGYDDIPQPASISLSGEAPYEALSADVTMAFPGVNVVGLDLAGELFTVGFWAEGAVFVPENTMMARITSEDPIIQNFLPNFIPEGEIETLKDEPYFKYTLGADYTFKSGVYLNGQFIHGFFTEAGEENLGNYLVARAEKGFFHDKLLVTLGGGFASARLMNWDRLQDTLAYFAFPDIQYVGIDNLEVDLGYFFIEGEPGTLFGGMTDIDQIFLKFKVSF